MSVVDLLVAITVGFNVVGVTILTWGAIGSAAAFFASHFLLGRRWPKATLNDARKFIVERTILSLDFFVAADIIRTVIKLTFEDLGLLAGIVTIRIVLTYFLERELGEKLPD